MDGERQASHRASPPWLRWRLGCGQPPPAELGPTLRRLTLARSSAERHCLFGQAIYLPMWMGPQTRASGGLVRLCLSWELEVLPTLAPVRKSTNN